MGPGLRSIGVNPNYAPAGPEGCQIAGGLRYRLWEGEEAALIDFVHFGERTAVLGEEQGAVLDVSKLSVALRLARTSAFSVSISASAARRVCGVSCHAGASSARTARMGPATAPFQIPSTATDEMNWRAIMVCYPMPLNQGY